MYKFLRKCGWKRKTVYANLLYVGVAAHAEDRMYNLLLRNLTRHVGELLFCFKIFKKLPHDVSAYPCKVCDWNFSLAEGAAPVLEKMRKGGIFLTAHYGNYEAMGPWLCRLGIPLTASYIPVKPALLNCILERCIRSVNGRSYSVNARTPRDFLRLLDSGKLFCLLADQDSRIASAQDGLFMGKPVCNNPLPEFLLKHRPETPVFVCWIEESLDSHGECCNRILHAQEFSTEKSAPVMAQFNAWLQSRILEKPALWYGFTHRRFYSKDAKMYR